MTLLEAENEYGEISCFIDRLKDLQFADDLRLEDLTDTLRDINFIRSKASLKPLEESQLINLIS